MNFSKRIDNITKSQQEVVLGKQKGTKSIPIYILDLLSQNFHAHDSACLG